MPKPPPNLKTSHLKPPTRRWFNQICAYYELESHHQRILLVAAEQWDRATEAREAIAEHGLVVTDRYGQLKTNPAAETERSSRILFLRSVRELQLDVESPGEEYARPATLPSAGRLRAV